MALHELTTNAGQYGALKQPGCHLEVRWRRELSAQLSAEPRFMENDETAPRALLLITVCRSFCGLWRMVVLSCNESETLRSPLC